MKSEDLECKPISKELILSQIEKINSQMDLKVVARINDLLTNSVLLKRVRSLPFHLDYSTDELLRAWFKDCRNQVLSTKYYQQNGWQLSFYSRGGFYSLSLE